MRLSVLFLSLGCLISFKSFAQDFFVTKSNDTTYCKYIEYATTVQGFICDLKYEDQNGRKVEIKKRKHVPKIIFMYRSGIMYEPMPLKTNKPDSYYRVGQRIVNGKLKVSRFDNRETKTVYHAATSTRPGGWRNETSGTYLFQLKMPDGKIIKINKRKKHEEDHYSLSKILFKICECVQGELYNRRGALYANDHTLQFTLRLRQEHFFYEPVAEF